jgi:acid phosphatase family membrane protein YuiD
MKGTSNFAFFIFNFSSMIRNEIMLFLVPILVGIIAEAIKFANYCRKHGWDLRYSIAYGHMPSAHTAFVASLVTTVALIDGFAQTSFAIALTLAIIVIFDALRLRVYMGEHAQYLNALTKELKLDESTFPRLKERVGHKPEEVAVGAILGILLTLFFFAIWGI